MQLNYHNPNLPDLPQKENGHNSFILPTHGKFRQSHDRWEAAHAGVCLLPESQYNLLSYRAVARGDFYTESTPISSEQQSQCAIQLFTLSTRLKMERFCCSFSSMLEVRFLSSALRSSPLGHLHPSAHPSAKE